ncbi:alpha-1,2-mannosyltransferase [[Emmonsia] crescens]|uniref:GDP-Man:Man(3)GlcNAc(2)-PP-Dol alpha-1,2-mannosyltransferase n=1 Tax=[Emmonsia] crescens TaxID=73230 RepID=A0A2B7ZDT1_9EURO|nr:alpha-1,2-mannosyltransferase [Emmonsia crescens]
MMLSPASSVATLVTLLALFLIAPRLAAFVFRFVFRLIGWLVARKYRWRRDLIRARIRLDEEEYQSRRAKYAKQEDEDWEKVEASGVGTNGNAAEDDWEGMIGFFHPFCNAGGGGERVLWAAVRATQKRWPKAICAIYTGDNDLDKTTMLERIENRFNICLYPPTVVFLYLSTRKYVLSSVYPRFTLLGQSLGSLVLGYDAFTLLIPDIFIDTMGYSFVLAFCHFLFPSIPTGAYVHYPTISTDMLDSLGDTSGTKGLNAGAGTGWKGYAKRQYWHAFAKLYGWVGGTIDVVMCNSSWTSAHINSLWLPSRQKRREFQEPTVVFPPVAVSELESIEIDLAHERESREPTILYIAQFRPEKNHALILRAFARFLNEFKKTHKSPLKQPPQLILIGSVRHSSPDETHIYNLRLLAHELKIRDNTTFICDASWPTIIAHLRRASIGVNAMWNEHFGIGVVEYQAAGLISVVHDSGGPRQDIVVDLGEGGTGFRATTEMEFAVAFEAALALPEEERVAMRLRARESSRRFTGEMFAERWVREMGKLVGLERRKGR